MKLEEMSVEQLQAEFERLESEMSPLIKQRELLNEKVKRLYQRQKQVDELKSKLQYAAMQESGEADWSMLLDAGFSGDRYYNESKAALKKLVPSGAVGFSGYFSDTQQHALQIKLTRHDKKQIEEGAKALELLVPFYKPLKEQHGWLIFDIFEASLSEYCSYKLGYNPATGKWYCGAWRSSYRYKKAHEYAAIWDNGPFDTAKEVLTVISDRYFYDLPNDE